MFRYISLVFLVAYMLVSISDTSAQNKNRKAHAHELGEDIYKHFTGTIGNRRVSLDLKYGYQGASNYGGSMYYNKDRQANPIALMIFEPQSFEHGVPMVAQEYSDAADFVDREEPHNWWTFVMADKKLTGMWHNRNRRDSSRIDLKEDYTHSSAMDMVVFTEQLPAAEHAAVKTATAGNRVHAMVVLSTSPTAATYINGESLRFLGMANLSSATRAAWSAYPEASAVAHFKNLTTVDVAGTVASRLTLYPVYNDNDMLVLRRTEGDFGTEAISYLCLDVREKRHWSFSDILVASNEALSALLEEVVRHEYAVPPDKKLSTLLLVDKMPVTQNIAILASGIFFTYRLGEIATKDKIGDEINLFVRYSQLSDMLTPAFRKRIGL